MKRRQRTILKSFDKVMDEARNGKRQEHEQIQRLKKVHLEKDEFTENKTIESALVSFVVEARQLEDHYQGHRKRMIQTVALALEDELNRIGKSELVCHISEELIKILKQVGIKWNAIYLRRCLDERYKDPVNRMNALARKRHPGVPQDTGKTTEELEASLNRKSTIGKYTIKFTLPLGEEKADNIRILAVQHEDGTKHGFLPVIIHVNATEQDATVELDKEEYDTFMKKVHQNQEVDKLIKYTYELEKEKGNKHSKTKNIKPKPKQKPEPKERKISVEEMASKILHL